MMKQTRSPNRSIPLELAAALGVLALVFLSFAHQPIDPSSGQVFRLADGSIPVFCGAAPQNGEHGTGFRCEACRLSLGADLPSVECTGDETFPRSMQVSATRYDISEHLGLIERVVHPRAPPFAGIFS